MAVQVHPIVRTMACLLACAAVAALGQDGARASLDEKIDEPVRAAMQGGDRVPVLVLCRTQLLLGPGAFEAFVAEHAGRPRRELRGEVVARLEAIADAEQPAVLAALGGVAVRRFWIVNGLAALLTPGEIERVAALDEVRFVYHAGAITSGTPAPGGVAEVLPDVERRPFSAKGRKVAWNLKQIRATKVWRSGNAGEGVVVALLDTGTDYTHGDLRRNIWHNDGEIPNNGVDDDANGYVDDLYGYDFLALRPEVGRFNGAQPHGTLTAGIVVGDGTGGTVTGVAPRARLMPLRFGNLDGMILAHEYAVENGADVMNMSFSIPDLGNVRGVWRLMSDHAVAAGLVLVSGVGNFQQTEQVPEQIRIPEGIPSVIGVGGVDRRLELAVFSSTGPVEWASVKFYGDYPLPAGLTKPDVSAFPGPDYPLHAPGTNGYIDPNPTFRGNSFSSPHVSGVAALMLSAAPDLAAWRVREILEATARDLDVPGKDTRTGAGLVDALAAVDAARADQSRSR
jgi:subtilisin family serine protease